MTGRRGLLPFVVSEVNGRWQRPVDVPGVGARSGSSQVTSVSCPSAGGCTAAGYNGTKLPQAFLVTRR